MLEFLRLFNLLCILSLVDAKSSPKRPFTRRKLACTDLWLAKFLSLSFGGSGASLVKSGEMSELFA